MTGVGAVAFCTTAKTLIRVRCPVCDKRLAAPGCIVFGVMFIWMCSRVMAIVPRRRSALPSLRGVGLLFLLTNMVWCFLFLLLWFAEIGVVLCAYGGFKTMHVCSNSHTRSFFPYQLGELVR